MFVFNGQKEDLQALGATIDADRHWAVQGQSNHHQTNMSSTTVSLIHQKKKIHFFFWFPFSLLKQVGGVQLVELVRAKWDFSGS